MRVIDSLSEGQREQIYFPQGALGFFEFFQDYYFQFDDMLGSLSREYYAVRSYSKLLNIRFEQAYKDLGESLFQSFVADVVCTKFREKWNETYTLLFNTDRKPLVEFERNDYISRNITDLKNYTDLDDKQNSKASKSTTTFSSTDTNKGFGFNSKNGIDTNLSTSSDTESSVSLPDDNFSNTREEKSGSETKNLTFTEDVRVSGRNKSADSLIEKEFDFMKRNLFFDIILSDIDSVITVGVY